MLKKATPLFAALCVLILFGSLFAFHYVANYHRDPLTFRSGSGLPSNEDFLLDLNLADADELDALPGIGSALSQRIVSYREENGPFIHTEQLLEIKGITPKIYQRILPYIIIGE